MSDFHDLAGLKRIAALLSAQHGPLQDLGAVLGELRSLLGSSALALWCYDDARAVFECVASGPSDIALPHHVSRSDPFYRVLQDAVMLSDAAHYFPGADVEPVLSEAGFTAAQLVALNWCGEPVGVLGVFDAGYPNDDDSRRSELLDVAVPLLAARVATAQVAADAQLELSEEHKRLMHIQGAIRRMLEQPDVEVNIVDAVDTIQMLGWQRVVLALFTSDMAVERVFSAGVSDDELAQYGDVLVPSDVWDRLLDGELEVLRHNGLYCLFSDVGEHARWQDDDLVFGLLQAGRSEVIGIIRVDAPVNGQRPESDGLRAIDILASQTAYVIENARMIDRVSAGAEELQDQVEELSMMHRADRELSTHLDVDRILRLTMDWAIRRTGAAVGVLKLMTDDRRALIPSVTLGQIDHTKYPYSAANPRPSDRGIIGQAVKTRETQVISDLRASDEQFDYFPTAQSVAVVPLTMREDVLGILVLGASSRDGFSPSAMDFLELLVRRAVVALDNARLFKQAEQMADDMTVIYTASRTITSTLERSELLQRIAQVMTVALECSSAVIFDFQKENETIKVLAVYRLGTAQYSMEMLPQIDEVCMPERYPMMRRVITQNRTVVVYDNDPSLSEAGRDRMKQDNIRAMVLVPLVAQNEMIGLAVVMEGRHERRFSPDDVFRIKTLSSQAAVALRQAMLYSEVLELEKLKSEMIRMASHDLRNPLNNIMGYVDLLDMSLTQDGIQDDQRMFIDNLKTSSNAMYSLLEDMLTLERIESEHHNDWQQFDFVGLVMEVCEEERAGAQLKHHDLTLERPERHLPVFGSLRQMRQAVSNMVGNAIKYTPEGGRIDVSVRLDGSRVWFQVVDNGFGISPKRQERIFERFYRAREPGTDHIAGTGLGLSLVKTVVERHGGEVWFESEQGQGSTFGFWIPRDEGVGVPQGLQGYGE